MYSHIRFVWLFWLTFVLKQILVSSILIRTDPNDDKEPMLSATSHIRVQVEQARTDVIRWVRRRWINVRQEGGFDKMDEWALRELAGGAYQLLIHLHCGVLMHRNRNRCECRRVGRTSPYHTKGNI